MRTSPTQCETPILFDSRIGGAVAYHSGGLFLFRLFEKSSRHVARFLFNKLAELLSHIVRHRHIQRSRHDASFPRKLFVDSNAFRSRLHRSWHPLKSSGHAFPHQESTHNLRITTYREKIKMTY